MAESHSEMSAAATAGTHMLRQRDWDAEVLSPANFRQRIVANTVSAKGVITFCKLAEAESFLQDRSKLDQNGPCIAVATTAPLQTHKAHCNMDCIVKPPTGDEYKRKIHVFLLTNTTPHYTLDIPQIGNAQPASLLTEVKLEVLPEGVVTEPAWDTAPLNTARTFLTNLGAAVASVRRAGERRIAATIAPSKSLREMSGHNGVIVRPAKVTNDPVVWLDSTATLAAALEFARNHAGRLIKSTKAYGIVVETQEARAAAWQALGKPEKSTESHYVITGMHYLTHPDSLVTALRTPDNGCTMIAHQQAGKTQAVKVRTQQQLPRFFSYNNQTLTATEVSNSHKLRRPKKKRPTEDKRIPFVNTGMASTTTAWNNIARGHTATPQANTTAPAPPATTTNVDTESRNATTRNASEIKEMRNDFNQVVERFNAKQAELEAKIHASSNDIQILTEKMDALAKMGVSLQGSIEQLQLQLETLIKRIPTSRKDQASPTRPRDTVRGSPVGGSKRANR